MPFIFGSGELMTQVVYNKLSIFTIAYDIGINFYLLKVQRLRLMAKM